MSRLQEFRFGEAIYGTSVLYFRSPAGWYIQIPTLEPSTVGEARFPTLTDARLWAAAVLHDSFITRAVTDDLVDLADGLSPESPIRPVTGGQAEQPEHGRGG